MKDLKKPNHDNIYNEEPVLYCKHCLSLKIMDIPSMDNSEFCEQCGSTDIGEINIKDWENLYEQKYGFKYLENKY